MSTTDGATIPSQVGRPRLGWPTMLMFGFGAVANTVKARGLATFLMVYYNQVLGLNPAMVGLATSIALIFDAIIDPTIGMVSDNVRTPWGRRHPFMYAAAIPVVIAFFMLWNPPTGWEGWQLFGYMLACLLAVRLFDTFFELPSSALLPELVSDYDKRTTLISIRNLFGVIGGLGMTILVLQVLMPERNGGILVRDGYLSYSILAGVIIFVAIIVSTAATHKFIPFLRQAPLRDRTESVATRTFTMGREVFETLQNRAFMVATLSGVFTAVATATRSGMELYFSLFFWGFNQGQISLIQIAAVVGAGLGLAFTPTWSKWHGKKFGAIWAYAIALVIGASPIILRLMHLMPDNGTPLLFWLIFFETIANTFFAIMTGVLLTSMIADVVEDVEVRTGRRSEGLLFSADNLFKKLVSAAGPLITGLILAFVAFPPNARRTGVEPEVLHNLALTYLPVAVVLYGIAILCLLMFRLDKSTHEQNLRTLEERLASDPEGRGPQDPTSPRRAAALIDPESTPNQSPGEV